jgi:hypothetical protein
MRRRTDIDAGMAYLLIALTLLVVFAIFMTNL